MPHGRKHFKVPCRSIPLQFFFYSYFSHLVRVFGLHKGSAWCQLDMLFGTFARSCTGPCEKFLKRSGKNFVGPLGACTCSRTGRCTKMWWRLFTYPPREVFVLRSEDRCWSECFLGMLVGNSCTRILFDIHSMSCCCICDHV